MIVVGIDEVGRGSWAGPLVAGAVILNKKISGLNDSKKLSLLQRSKLDLQIRKSAKAYGLGWVSHLEVDTLGLSQAITLAMTRALSRLKQPYDRIIIDGSYNFLASNPRTVTLIKADTLEPSVSAASILAKQARDNWMKSIAAKRYPHYFFEKHVGYGTAMHRDLLKKYGICDIHRRSYKPIQEIMNLTEL